MTAKFTWTGKLTKYPEFHHFPFIFQDSSHQSIICKYHSQTLQQNAEEKAVQWEAEEEATAREARQKKNWFIWSSSTSRR